MEEYSEYGVSISAYDIIQILIKVLKMLVYKPHYFINPLMFKTLCIYPW